MLFSRYYISLKVISDYGPSCVTRLPIFQSLDAKILHALPLSSTPSAVQVPTNPTSHLYIVEMVSCRPALIDSLLDPITKTRKREMDRIKAR
ncbi:hypothetical protein E4T56_gene9902 [Termitomyces sp. T112]|nr:hypothetical protein E4T56_gene9902 [Termitomyces sp. T112]